MLELIEFTPSSGRTIREGAKSLDYGICDIAFIVKEIDKIYHDLTEEGFTFVSPPVQFQPLWVPHAVKEAIVTGPDNVPISHIERMKYEEYEVKSNYKRLNHSALIVDDIKEAIKFYHDTLGLDLTSEVIVPEGLIAKVLAIPLDTEVKLAFIERKDENALIMEFMELSVKGKSLASVARPPNLGLFMYSFEVDDLLLLTEMLEKEGIAILSGPVELHTELHGKMKAITVEAPGDTMIELFER